MYDTKEHTYTLKKSSGEKVTLTEEELIWDYKISPEDKLYDIEMGTGLLPGVYYPEIKVGSLSSNYKLTIKDFEIESIDVSDINITKNTNGSWILSPTPGEDPYYAYSGLPKTVKVKFTNGKTKELSPEDIANMGYWCDSDLGYLQAISHFGVGEHIVHFTLYPLDSVQYKLIISEPEANALPLKDRFDYYISAWDDEGMDDISDWGESQALIKTSFDEDNNKLIVTLKTEKDFIKEGRTKEEYFEILTAHGYIDDPNKWNYNIQVRTLRPDSLNNPIEMETADLYSYGQTYLKHFMEIDEYLQNPDGFDYMLDNADRAAIADFGYRVSINNEHVTFDKVDEYHYGVVWKAEPPVEDIIDVIFVYQESPETLSKNHLSEILVISLILLLSSLILLRRNSKVNE